VLDYVNGGDLFVHLQHRRRFTHEQARLYTAEMVLAFEHLHSQGIAYRDLKPENILMGTDGAKPCPPVSDVNARIRMGTMGSSDHPQNPKTPNNEFENFIMDQNT